MEGGIQTAAAPPMKAMPTQPSLPFAGGGNGSTLGTGDMSNLGHVIGMLAAAARERNQSGGSGLIQ